MFFLITISIATLSSSVYLYNKYKKYIPLIRILLRAHSLYDRYENYISYFNRHISDVQELIDEKQKRTSKQNVILYLIRHAESVMNINNHLVCGRTPSTPLSSRGIEQAHALGERLRQEGIKFNAIFSSDTIRASETAKIVSQYIDHDIENIGLVPELTEMSQGAMEGIERTVVYTKETLDKINNDLWNFKHPGVSESGELGESIRDVENRIKQFIEQKIFVDKIDDSVNNDTPVIGIFAHSNTIKSFLRLIQGSNVEGVIKNTIDNTSITEVSYNTANDGNLCGWIIKRVNDSNHIKQK